jgi:hypothetical protein
MSSHAIAKPPGPGLASGFRMTVSEARRKEKAMADGAAPTTRRAGVSRCRTTERRL